MSVGDPVVLLRNHYSRCGKPPVRSDMPPIAIAFSAANMRPWPKVWRYAAFWSSIAILNAAPYGRAAIASYIGYYQVESVIVEQYVVFLVMSSKRHR